MRKYNVLQSEIEGLFARLPAGTRLDALEVARLIGRTNAATTIEALKLLRASGLLASHFDRSKAHTGIRMQWALADQVGAADSLDSAKL